MYKHLRAGANVDLSQRQVKDKLGNMLDLNLKAGAAGEIQMPAERKIAHKQRRKRGAALHGSERLVANVDGSGPSVRDQLYAILKKNAMRVIDLFRDWDEDGNGMITFSEFRRAISTLGYEAEEADVALSSLKGLPEGRPRRACRGWWSTCSRESTETTEARKARLGAERETRLRADAKPKPKPKQKPEPGGGKEKERARGLFALVERRGTDL